jgi:hypothetical protein
MTRLIILLAVSIGLVAFTPEEGTFDIVIYQHDQLVSPGDNGEYLLDKQPFRIQVRMKNLEGVYLHAGFTDSLYRLEAKDSIPGYKDVPPNVMAEESFNKDQEMIISEDRWAFWFFDPNREWHRFDKDVLVEENIVTANKTIRQFYMGNTEQTVPVKDISLPLYLFFFSALPNDNDFDPGVELQRQKIRINWK